MKIGEVCLLTQDVPRLADFYRNLLCLEGSDSDPVHQTLLGEETMFTVMRTDVRPAGQNMELAFTVEDMDAAYRRVLDLGVEVIEGPAKRPWGAVNMSFRDPDGNIVYFRSFSQNEEGVSPVPAGH